MFAIRRYRCGAIRGLGDQLDIRLTLQRRDNTSAHERMIVHAENPNWIA